MLGEYYKLTADPLHRLEEVLRAQRSTGTLLRRYHQHMGFLRDIERMPDMYDYSLQFFDRFYRPENTTLLVCGDIRTADVLQLVVRYWGAGSAAHTSWSRRRSRHRPGCAKRGSSGQHRRCRMSRWRSARQPTATPAPTAPRWT